MCAERFAGTQTGHRPNPVVWFNYAPRLLIASQAPGMKAHLSTTPFLDPSGVRLRDWLGLDEAAFYDRKKVSILPMAFCFPGYDAKGSDLLPPRICHQTWHGRIMAEMAEPPLRVIVGGAAHRFHLGAKTGVTETVRNWRAYAPDTFVLPHPSWRNTAWLKKNPWFEAEVLPALRTRVQEVME